jgi:hypothetical protein
MLIPQRAFSGLALAASRNTNRNEMKTKIIILVLLISTLNSCKKEANLKIKSTNTFLKSSLQENEIELNNIYKKINDARLGSDTINWKALETENNKFENKILKNLSGNPQSIIYPFDSLKNNNINIVSSKDKLLRIYSWNTWKGGTMYDFVNLFQYKSNGKVFTKIIKDTVTDGEGEYTPFYSQIFTLKNKKDTYYLCVYNGIYSSKDASQSIKILKIDNNKLEDVKLIKTENGLTNSIDLYFDFFSVVDRPERPLKLIKYDHEKKEIYIPILTEKEEVTNRFQIYNFNGEFFEPQIIN